MSKESNKIASNTLVQIIGRMLVMVMALISTKLITNYLGPEGTGFYTTIVTYFNFIIVIADFGLFSVAVREVSKDYSNYKKILGNIFYIRLISALIATIIAVIIIFFTKYPTEIKNGVLIASLFPIFNLTGSVYDMFLQVKLEMKKVAIAEIISKIIALAGVIIAVAFNLGIYIIITTVSLAAVSNFLIKMLISKKQLPLNFRYDKSILPHFIKMSVPLGIVFIVNNIYFKVDSLMLFYYKGAADVGIYAVAYRVLETTLFAGSYLTSSLKPLLSVSVENDKEKTTRALKQGTNFLFFMALTISIICITFPKEIILFLSNEEFIKGANVTIILGFATIFIYLGGMFGEIMIAKDMRRTMLKISGFILLFNVALNMYLIPRYGFIGAAYATLISEVVLLAISWNVAKKATEISLDWARITKLVSIGLFSVLFGYFLKRFDIYFLINMLFTVITYVALSYFLDAIPKSVVNNYLISLKSKWTKKTSPSL
ncbi:MAG: flippase [Patescibacteria group bacterium]